MIWGSPPHIFLLPWTLPSLHWHYDASPLGWIEILKLSQSPWGVLKVSWEVTNSPWLLSSLSLVCAESQLTVTSLSREGNTFRKALSLFGAVLLGRPGDFFFLTWEANDCCDMNAWLGSETLPKTFFLNSHKVTDWFSPSCFHDHWILNKKVNNKTLQKQTRPI